MTAYLVRHRAETDHQIVGIFVCKLLHLWDHIDAVSDVDLCEYTVLPEGGIEWPAPRAQKIPLKNWDEENNVEGEPLSFAEATISETWIPSFYQPATWHPIPLPRAGMGIVAEVH